MKYYVAGKWEDKGRCKLIMRVLKEYGHEITCDWTNHEYPTEDIQRKIKEYAVADIEGVKNCERLIIVAYDHYQYRGALVELGIGIAYNKEIYILGNALDTCIFLQHPLVKKVNAFREVMEN